MLLKMLKALHDTLFRVIRNILYLLIIILFLPSSARIETINLEQDGVKLIQRNFWVKMSHTFSLNYIDYYIDIVVNIVDAAYMNHVGAQHF